MQFAITNFIKQNSVSSAFYGLLLYVAYPELKKQWYEIKPESIPECKSIQRKRVQLTEEQEISIENEFEECGFDYHDAVGFEWSELSLWSPQNYWENENQYELTPEIAEELMKASFEVHSMCLEAVDFVIQNPTLMTTAFQIPENLQSWIIKSWENKQRDLIARIDFMHNEQDGFKFLEVNADTPTVLLEAGMGQQIWAEHTQNQQFNIISQTLNNAWKEILWKNNCKTLIGFSYGVVKDANFIETEDKCNVRYLINLADSSIPEENIQLKDISYLDQYLNQKSDGYDRTCLWKLYPYEWLAQESAGQYFDNKINNPNIELLEPVWKIIMSNKAILPVLWALFPYNQYLLPSYFSVNYNTNNEFLDYQLSVAKRVFGREGKAVTFGNKYRKMNNYIYNAANKGTDLSDNQTQHRVTGAFGRPVFQKLFQPTNYKGRTTTLGSWIVHGVPAGLGIREDINPITANSSSFVPHSIKKDYTQQDNLIQNQQGDIYSNGSISFRNEINETDNSFIYKPSDLLSYQASDKQFQIREKLYGHNSSIEKIYSETPYSKIKIQKTNLKSEQDKKMALQNIEKQLNCYQEIYKSAISSRRRSGGGFYGSGSSSSSEHQSSAAQKGYSYSSRQQTGSHGSSFSRSS